MILDILHSNTIYVVLFCCFTILIAMFLTELNDIVNKLESRVKLDYNHIKNIRKLQTMLIILALANMSYFLFNVAEVMFQNSVYNV